MASDIKVLKEVKFTAEQAFDKGTRFVLEPGELVRFIAVLGRTVEKLEKVDG